MSTHTHTPHVLPLRIYWSVFFALVIGTLLCTTYSAAAACCGGSRRAMNSIRYGFHSLA